MNQHGSKVYRVPYAACCERTAPLTSTSCQSRQPVMASTPAMMVCLAGLADASMSPSPSDINPRTYGRAEG